MSTLVSSQVAANALPSSESSHAASLRAVRNYLQAAGVGDAVVLDRESRRIVDHAAAQESDPSAVTAAALHGTIYELEQWIGTAKAAVVNGVSTSDQIVPAQLTNLLRDYSDAVRRNRPAELEELLQETMCPVVPRPRVRKMRKQVLSLVPGWLAGYLGNRSPKSPPAKSKTAATGRAAPQPTSSFLPRAVLLLLTVFATLAGTWRFFGDVTAGPMTWLALPLTALFAVLFFWIAFSFWVATFGFAVLLGRRRRSSPSRKTTLPQADSLPVTAVVMPIYNEDPRTVFANLRAVAESLRTTGCAMRFHLFALSDTTDPLIRLEEERAWAALTTEFVAGPRIFYRHRTRNLGRKAGNIADFCQRWGANYKYMTVLDADSLMSGPTLVEMVRRMEADADVGILQAPPLPVNRRSAFGRLQQFAAHTYGPVFLEGFALWSKCDGNYWGHNAIIRLRPFMEHCDLPVLPGDGPLGGEILSHDFVEAALMRRAGWKVCLAHDLDGSYEECPATMLGFAIRDQRWCQGNLQHVRLLLADGFHPVSRMHLGMGAMSYLSSPLWLVFLVLSLLAAFLGGNDRPATAPSGLWLFGVSMAMLLLPKLWGIIAATCAEPQEKFPQRRRLVASAALEVLVSMLIAPIMMLFHSRFVWSTLRGTKVGWNAQQRNDGAVSLQEAVAVHGGHTLFGLAVGAAVAIGVPSLFPWLLPIILGLVLSIPLAMLLGSVRAGQILAERGFLLIPEEIAPSEVLQRQQAARAELKNDASDRDAFSALLQEPARYLLHAGIVRATGSEAPLSADDRQAVTQAVAAGGVAALSSTERRAVLDDLPLLESLHVLARVQADAHAVTA